MKKTFITMATLLVWLFSGCERTLFEPTPEKPAPISIGEAGTLAKSHFGNWLSSARLTESYAAEDLYKAKDNQNDQVMWIAPSASNRNMVLSFAILKDDTIIKPLNHFVSYISEDTIQDKISLIDGTWLGTITRDGSRTVEINEQLFASGRIQNWWGDFDDCFGKLNAPIPDCNTCNWLFGTVANATTALLYTPASVLVCAGVATGKALKEN